jgi:tetratricopeptide (TPR) repeat protein
VVRHLRNNAQNLYGSLFDWSFEQLKPASQTLLAVAAALQRPASVDLFVALLDWTPDEVSDAAEDALRLTLLRETQGHGQRAERVRLLEMDEVTRRYATPKSHAPNDIAKALVRHLVNKCGTDGWIDESHTHTVAELVEHIDWAWSVLTKHHETQDMLHLVYSCAPSLGHLGFNHLRKRYSREAYQQIEHDPTRALDQARLLVRQLGWVHFIAHEFEDAMHCYTEGMALAKNAGDKLTEAMALKTIGQIRKELGDLQRARECLHETAFMLSEEYATTHEMAATLSALSSLERDCDDLHSAIKYLKDAVKITRQLENAAELSVVLNQKLARLLLSAGKYDEAEKINQEAEDANRAMKRQAGVAYTRQLEALILEARGDRVGSWQKCREAFGLFQAIGMQREIMKDYDRMRKAIAPA